MPGSWFTWPARAPRQASPERRLLRRYNVSIAGAYAAVLLALAGFFAFQLRQDLRTEIARLEGKVADHGHVLDLVLSDLADQAETLRTVLAAHQSPETCQSGRQIAAQGPLRQVGPTYTWEVAAGPTAGGRLAGEGVLAGRSEGFYCDLGATLAVAPHLQALVVHLPAAGRAHLLSAEGFRLETPSRVPTLHANGQGALPEAELWRQATPQANPQRHAYWAPAYFGGADMGLLAPVAVPLDHGGRFLGVLAIDLRLDALDRIDAAMGYSEGSAGVVDGHGHVLSHPVYAAHSHRLRAPGRFDQAFPAQALPSADALASLPAGRAQERAGWVVIRKPLSAAPWQLVYAVPVSTLWQALLVQRGAALASALVLMGLLMALIHAFTWHSFVGPAARLVGHALAESRQAAHNVPDVPRAWRPWFEQITRVFRESLQLGSLRRELDIAARMQQSILPRQWPRDARYDLWGTMRAAKDIGGDFYDHFELPGGRRGLVVADVSGKGISAGLFGMVCKTLLRAIATRHDHAAGEVARQVNEGLCADNESSMFVTAFYGQYDPASGRLVYANAGHPPPLVLRAQGSLQWLSTPGGTALGVVQGLAYEEGAVDLAPGDTLLVFTDGVTEAINAQGQEFGKLRLSALFEGRPTDAAREAIERMLERLARYAQGVEAHDDITCLALHCRALGEGLAGGHPSEAA